MDRRTFIATALATAAAPAAFAGGHGRLFSFVGLSNHTVTGTAEIAGTTVNLLDDFVFDGAPDPKVALGKDGTYDPATLSGLLKANSGASSYELPAGINPDDYNEVWIWCERFNVPLAVATAK
ncbi:MAG: DM13 domain-containing protein [Pseudomonadota bacterium]